MGPRIFHSKSFQTLSSSMLMIDIYLLLYVVRSWRG